MKVLKKGSSRKENVTKSTAIKIKEDSRIVSFKTFFHNIFRNTSIQSRLIISFLLLSILPLGSMGYLAYSLSSRAVEDKIKSYSADLMNSTGDYANVQTARIIDTNNDIVLSQFIQNDLASLNEKNSFDRLQTIKSVEQYLMNIYAKNSDILCSIIVTNDGERVVYSQDSLISSEDVEKIRGMLDQYVKEANSNTVTLCTNWRLPDKNAVLFARHIPNIQRGNQIGIILTLINERYFNESYKDINLGEGSEVFIVDKRGQVISSLNQEEIGTTPFDAEFMSIAIKSSQEKTAFSQGDGLVAASHMDRPDWYLISKIPYSYLFAESKTIGNYIIVFLAICLVLSLVAAFFISRSISNPLKVLMKDMEKAKEGDLTRRIEDKSRDELGAVARHFNDMLANIKFLVAKVHVTAQEVITGSDTIATSATQSLNFSQQIALAIQQIAQGSSKQASDTIDIVTNMNLLSNDISNVGSFMVKASDVLSNAKNANSKIQSNVYELNEKAKQTSSAFEAIVSDIYELNKDIEEIGNIIKLIFAISEQTNLLSLNAAIEAARAGEAGRGFAVVAEEVKKLANQSKEASNTIKSIVSKIQSKAGTTVQQASNASRIVKEQMSAVKATDQSFKEVFESMDSIFSIMNEMSESVEKVLESKEKVLRAMENIAGISQESAACSQEVSSSTQEQIASFRQLTDLSHTINDLALELDKMISVFRI